MSDRWEIEVHVYPFSTGAGADEDQKAAGERVRKHIVPGKDIREALQFAELFAEGVRMNPRIWEVPIMAIRKVFPS